jgi:transposase
MKCPRKVGHNFSGFYMPRYSISFKQSVVSAYAGGTEGFRAISARFGVDHSTVRKWVAIHAAHGLSGLEKKFSRYDAEFKLSVLHRIWEDGLSHRQAAAVFNIRNKSSIADWERRYESGGTEALIFRRTRRPVLMPPPTDEPPNSTPNTPPIYGELQSVPIDETRSREELLAELNYLRMENAYLKN